MWERERRKGGGVVRQLDDHLRIRFGRLGEREREKKSRSEREGRVGRTRLEEQQERVFVLELGRRGEETKREERVRELVVLLGFLLS